MERVISTWHSPAVGREMGLARYGHYGKPVVFFPTGGGDYLDCERFLMVKALTPLIEAGRIKLYAVDSTSRDSWANADCSPRQRVAWQVRYDNYLRHELVPFIRHDCGGSEQGIAATGASLGGYNALNAVCKHPEHFDLMIGMSGTYVLDRKMEGYWDEDYYFNSPTQFVPNLSEGPQLQALRRARFVIGLGEAYENPTYAWAVATALGKKGLWNRVEKWGPGSGHDWPTWRTMLPLFLSKLA